MAKNIFKITVKIAKQISEFENSWDELLPSRHHLKSGHLRAFEHAGIEDIENNYVQVFLKNKLIGLVYLQKFQIRHHHLNYSGDQPFLLKLAKYILPAQLPILVCGHLFRINFQGFYFKNQSHQPLLFDAIELFRHQHKKYKPLGILIKDCKEVLVEQSCKIFGYRFFNGDVTMEISRKAHWLTFDGYLKDLNKKYLKRAKKIIESFKTIEQKELNASEILDHSAQIDKLYRNVVNKQTIRLGIVNSAYFYELKKDLLQNFEFYALYQNKVMVGFYTFIFYEKEMETHYIGLDYEANKTCKLYFNILFKGTEKMIARQFDKMELGRTSKEAKVSLGALPKQIFNYVKINNPFIKITVNYFLNRFNKAANQNLVERTPLK